MESARPDLPQAVGPVIMTISGAAFMSIETNYVITLLADRDKEPLSQAFVNSMLPSLALKSFRVESIQWLEPNLACDLIIRSNDLAALDRLLQEILRDQPYDGVAQPVDNRRKKLLISDMDSTMITVECIDELADFVGKKDEVSRITERAMNGELNFELALIERVALLKGLPVSVLQQCYNERVKMMAGAKTLVSTMRHFGAHSVLVSGGFTFFTTRVKDELGFHEDFANTLLTENGKLTGDVRAPILGKEAKLATLQQTCKKLRLTASDVLAVGDGANDLPMLQASGLGVAYHAKPVVRSKANARINLCNLNALLFVQGYTKDDFKFN